MAAWLGELNPSFGYRFFLQLKNISWLSPNIIHISWNFYHVKDNDIWASRPIFMIIKDKIVWLHHPLAFDIFIWILIGLMGKKGEILKFKGYILITSLQGKPNQRFHLMSIRIKIITTLTYLQAPPWIMATSTHMLPVEVMLPLTYVSLQQFKHSSA